MKKKTIIIIIAAVVAVALAITGAVIWISSTLKDNGGGASSGTENTGDMTISIGSDEAKNGSTVKVPVSVSSNEGFMAVMLECAYDTSVLEYVTYDKGDFLTDYEVTNENGVIKFMSLEDGDVDDNGVMVYLEFKVIGESGSSSDLTLTIKDGNICNYDEEILDVTTTNGKITVK